MSEKTIFTHIVEREIPAHIVGETERTLSFLDIEPISKGHVLVISKEQIDHLDDCDDVTYQEIFAEVHRLSKVLRTRFTPKRVGVMVHGFDIPHAHVHVVPFYTGNEADLSTTPRQSPTQEELKNIQESIVSSQN